ncbi:MAG: TRAP transporter large permease [Rhodobacter sp.]|nr:TRAP transporter large permease [Rhodobacter sp.]
MLTASIGFVAAFALIFFGIPIALSLFVVGLGGIWILVGYTPSLSMTAIVARETTMSYSLTVIPLFLLMGNFISGSGIASDLFRAAQATVGRRRGGLAMATVIASGGFAAVCGSSVATAVTMGKVALPEMRKYNYSDSLATASIAAGGTLGILIPPSVVMIIYGILTESHIGRLFAAGIVPGVLAVLGYMAAVQFTIWRNPDAAPVPTAEQAAEVASGGRKVWPVLLLFLIVLGGIYGGIFTATEAAGIGATGALAFGLWRRALPFRKIVAILIDTAETTATLFAMVIGATLFAQFMNYTGVHEGLVYLVSEANLAPWAVVAAVLLVYLLLGCVLDSLSMILLTIPVIFPVIMSLGFDPIWFGILVVMMVELGLITPPMGVNLFVIKSVAENTKLLDVIRGIVPFVAVDVIRVLIIALIPALTLWLPNLFFG